MKNIASPGVYVTHAAPIYAPETFTGVFSVLSPRATHRRYCRACARVAKDIEKPRNEYLKSLSTAIPIESHRRVRNVRCLNFKSSLSSR